MILQIDTPSFNDVVSNNAPGLIVASIFFAVFLIAVEQRKEQPRRSMIYLILGLIGAGFLGAFFIHLANQSDKKSDNSKLINLLEGLSSKGAYFPEAYFVDKNGDPKTSSLQIDSFQIQLSENLLATSFKEQKREFELSSDKSKLYIKTNSLTNLGYITIADLKKELFVAEDKVKSEDLLFTSVTRGEIPSDVIDYSLPKDKPQAAKYMLKILKDPSASVDLQDEACKGLCHGEILKKLEPGHFELLINHLNTKRRAPHKYWELAQVYYTKPDIEGGNGEEELDKKKRFENLEEYVLWHLDRPSFEDEEKDILLRWLDDAVAKLQDIDKYKIADIKNERVKTFIREKVQINKSVDAG